MTFTTGWIKGRFVEIDLASIGSGHHLHRPVAEAFIAMATAARRDGIVLRVNSSFRSMQKQQELHSAYRAAQEGGQKPSLVAMPGHSSHQAGCSVDINRAHDDLTNNGIADGKTDTWLQAHASAYGFVDDVKSEPWHWTHVATLRDLTRKAAAIHGGAT